jgi:hypothetical protein
MNTRAYRTGTILMALCGTSRLGAQQPALPANADSARIDTLAVDSATAYRRFTLEDYTWRVFGPRALLRDVAVAGIGQALKRPAEWPNTWEGYGNRMSSRLGSAAISQAVLLGVSVAFDERPARFTLCQCTGNGSRFVRAAVIPWQMDSPNGTHFSLIAPVSEIGSAILLTNINPRGFSVRDGLVSGATGVLLSSLTSVAREFWPWHRRPPGF